MLYTAVVFTLLTALASASPVSDFSALERIANEAARNGYVDKRSMSFDTRALESIANQAAVLGYPGSFNASDGGSDLGKRDTPGTTEYSCAVDTYLAAGPDNNAPGDGFPHQNYYDVQLSDNIDCDADGCSVGSQNSDSISVGFSFGTNSNFKPSFFQGSFSVSNTWSTGNSYTCNAEAGDTVCIWQRVAHTAYSVAGRQDNQDCGDPVPVNIMRSPNTNNQGGGFFCVHGSDCQSKGANYWASTGCAGGPQGYCGS